MHSKLDNQNNGLLASIHHPIGLAGVLAAGFLFSGCMGRGEANGAVEVIDMRSGELEAGTLESINGSYGLGCDERTGDWSLAAAQDAVLDHPVLSVLLNDDDCELTITEVWTDTALVAADPTLTLGLTYLAEAAEFGIPVEFYGNAKIDSLLFASDFVITLIYSDDPALATGDNTAQFEVVESSASDSAVLAPDYTLSVAGLSLLTDVDNIVVSAAGNAVLTEGDVTGEFYVVVDASGLTSYAAIDAAYRGATPTAIAGNIPAADFLLVGDDLTTPQKRTLIVATFTEDVAAYQRFEITFNPAP